LSRIETMGVMVLVVGLGIKNIWRYFNFIP